MRVSNNVTVITRYVYTVDAERGNEEEEFRKYDDFARLLADA
jgi:hypothetical protein